MLTSSPSHLIGLSSVEKREDTQHGFLFLCMMSTIIQSIPSSASAVWPLSMYQPPPRVGHFATSVCGETYLCGGVTDDIVSQETVFTFLQREEAWQKHITTGTTPPIFASPRLRDGACTSKGHTVYLYGGWDGNRYSDELYSLDTGEMEWRKVSCGPVKSSGCGIVHLRNKLITFGGYGPQPVPTQPGAAYLEDMGGDGWNNELHIFDLEKGEECLSFIPAVYSANCHGK